MFRKLASLKDDKPEEVFFHHPVDLACWLEAYWAARARRTDRPLPALPFSPAQSTAIPLRAPGGPPIANTEWHHLIYAYMIENTGAFQIFRRAVREYMYGEKLGVPTELGTQSWLRNTESLFMREQPFYHIFALRSDLRPDPEATRRNAYFRMFGLGISHQPEDGRNLQLKEPVGANKGFVTTLQDFLREVWIGIENAPNTSGPNPTDRAGIASLANKIHGDLTARRRGGNLAREEFLAVATMSWFHLTIEFDSPLVVSLGAQANSAAQRLENIGLKVGLPPHPDAANFLRMAEDISVLLTQIERGDYNTESAVPALYQEPLAGGQNPVRDAVLRIINDWSLATRFDIKGGKALERA